MYKVLFYQTEQGKSLVYEFVCALDTKTRAKVYRHIDYLKEHGPNLIRPFSDVVRGKIRELRVKFSHNNVRLFYFFFVEHEIVLVHGILKKTQALDPNDIEVAEKRMAEWMARCG